MDCEQNVIYEKIINEIDAVFTKNPELSGFEIIPLVANQNKSPVIHIDNNLGLESWCLQHVYKYAHNKILSNKLDNRKNLNGDIIKYLNCAILINPDVATFWNVRRKLCGNNKLCITKEFHFTAIVLSRKPKSNESFYYRRWLFSFRSEESNDWTFELKLCERCADKSSSNYHAWCHREWVLQKAPYLLKFEPHQTEKFIRKHIGDYSGYHHRQYVLNRLIEIGFYEQDDITNNNFIYLKEFISSINNNNRTITSTSPPPSPSSIDLSLSDSDLIKLILPNINLQNYNENRIKSFLYCLNLAAYDLEFCHELKDMFGYRDAFDYHRKAILKFIVDNCLSFNNRTNITKCNGDGGDGYCGSGDEQQPCTKMVKFENKFLNAIKESERYYGGELHKKWCQIFLGFEY